MTSPLDDLPPPNPLDDLPPPAQSQASPSKEDPDVEQFRKLQGRNPTQDELASIRGGKQGNLFGALGNTFISKPIQGVAGVFRGLFDIGTGKGGQRAAQDVEDINASPEMTSTDASLTNATLGSRFNPMNWPDMSGVKLGDFTMEHTNSPALATAARVLPDAAAALLGMRHGGAEGTPSPMSEPETSVGASSKYSGAVAAERARLQDIHARGVSAGLDLPEGGTQARFDAASANNTQVANSVIRRHFGLPDDPDGAAPLTPQMMGAVRSQVASETYGPVRAEPSISLSASATDAIDALPPVIRNKLKLQGRPLSDVTPEQVSGGDFVDMSRRLRDVATSFDKAYHRGGHPEAGALADLTHDAVDAWEESGRDTLRATGRGDIADKWEAGRTTIAQTHDVEAALDKSGNVNVAALGKRPYLTGDLDMLANLGGRYPDAFKVTRINAPAPGLARRAVAGTGRVLAPIGGAAAGGFIAGPWGAAGGAATGRVLGERFAEKVAPQ